MGAFGRVRAGSRVSQSVVPHIDRMYASCMALSTGRREPPKIGGGRERARTDGLRTWVLEHLETASVRLFTAIRCGLTRPTPQTPAPLRGRTCPQVPKPGGTDAVTFHHRTGTRRLVVIRCRPPAASRRRRANCRSIRVCGRAQLGCLLLAWAVGRDLAAARASTRRPAP